MSEFIIGKIEIPAKCREDRLGQVLNQFDQQVKLEVDQNREELQLLLNIANAARQYVQETKAWQDLDSWRELKEALRKWNERGQS